MPHRPLRTSPSGLPPALARFVGPLAFSVPAALAALASPAPALGSSTPPQAAPTQRGSTVALEPGGFTALVADADNRALHRVDLPTGEVTSIDLGCTPEQLVPIGNGLVAVALRDCNRVALVDLASGQEVLSSQPLPAEPWGLSLTPGGDLLVTSAFGGAVTSLEASTLSKRWSLPLGREPRGVVVAADGRRAFVTHAVGSWVSELSLDGPLPRLTRVGLLGAAFRNRVDRASAQATEHPTTALAFAAALSPSGTRLFVPHLAVQNGKDTRQFVSSGYGGVSIDEDTSVSTVAVFSVGGGGAPIEGRPSGAASPLEASGLTGQGATALAHFSFDPAAPTSAPPRQARAVEAVGTTLLVASLGTDELVELDARAVDPALAVRRVFPVGSGPTGIATSPERGLAVVWAQHDHALSIVDLGSGAVSHLPVAADPLPPDVAAGRKLFFSEVGRSTSRDGRACASCHPDGRDDGLVWALGDGPRQTPVLAGRLHEGPFGWLGHNKTLEENVTETISRLGGSGLDRRRLLELTAFLRRGLRQPPRDPPPPDDRVARGRELFHSEEVGCSGCHSLGAEGSDRRVHDVASAHNRDHARAFRTPPLNLLAGSAPYFHDGRYETLEALLDDNLDRMGHTSQLSPDDLGALVAFLRTL